MYGYTYRGVVNAVPLYFIAYSNNLNRFYQTLTM